MILRYSMIEKIDIMKLDIEGYEQQVLEKFFAESAVDLWPKYICTEVSHTPKVRENSSWADREDLT